MPAQQGPLRWQLREEESPIRWVNKRFIYQTRRAAGAGASEEGPQPQIAPVIPSQHPIPECNPLIVVGLDFLLVFLVAGLPAF